MQNKLQVAILQTNLVWENPKQNRINLNQKMDAIEGDIDLIILPEMFTSGFTMSPKTVAETMSGETINWLLKRAEEKGTAIMGSLVVSENNKYYNRLVFVEPNGALTYYDKKHRFTLAGEEKVYEAGEEKIIIEYKDWKICPLICYDLRFPVWARNVEDYDVLIYVANWPKQRIKAWDVLLKARAVENMSYCIGVNRVGLDANNYEYPGHSAVYNVLGEKMSTLEDNKESTEIVVLEKEHIQYYRNKLDFLNDRDNFNLVD